MKKHTFEVYLAHPDAVMPLRAHDYDAGFDLCSIEKVTLNSHERKLVHTGVHVVLEPGWELQLRPRSGNALSLGLTLVNSPGTIDATYIGELKIILYNTSDSTVTLPKGAKIAQMVFKEVPEITLRRVSKLPTPEHRGHNGYGSTGLTHKKVKLKKT